MMNNQSVANVILDAMVETSGITSVGARVDAVVDHVFDYLESPYSADHEDAAWAHDMILDLIDNTIGILDTAEAFIDAFEAPTT